MIRDFIKNKKTILNRQERLVPGKRNSKNQNRVLYPHTLSAPDKTSKVITSREEAEWRAFFAKMLLLLFAVVMILISIIGDYGLLETAELEHQETQLTQQIHALQQQKEQMLKEISAMRNSLEYIEVLARRELGLVLPEEKIYHFPQLVNKPREHHPQP